MNPRKYQEKRNFWIFNIPSSFFPGFTTTRLEQTNAVIIPWLSSWKPALGLGLGCPRLPLAAGLSGFSLCFQEFILWSSYVEQVTQHSGGEGKKKSTKKAHHKQKMQCPGSYKNTIFFVLQIYKEILKCASKPFMNGKTNQCRGIDNSFSNDLVVPEEPLQPQIRSNLFFWQRRGFVTSLWGTHIPLLYICYVTSSRNHLQNLGTYLIMPENSTAY